MEYLVLDAGPLIRGHGSNFHKLAKRFVTVAEVLAEVRDKVAREKLLTLPFEIEIRTPSEASLVAVAEFARKTGDFSSLSRNDLKLLALVHTLEVETGGASRLRSEPSRSGPAGKKPQTSSSATSKQSKKKGDKKVTGTKTAGDEKTVEPCCSCEHSHEGHDHDDWNEDDTATATKTIKNTSTSTANAMKDGGKGSFTLNSAVANGSAEGNESSITVKDVNDVHVKGQEVNQVIDGTETVKEEKKIASVAATSVVKAEEDEEEEEEEEGEEEEEEDEEDEEEEDDEDDDDEEEEEEEEEEFNYCADEFPALVEQSLSLNRDVPQTTNTTSWAGIAKKVTTVEQTKKISKDTKPPLSAWAMPQTSKVEGESAMKATSAEPRKEGEKTHSPSQNVLSRILTGGGSGNAASSSKMEEEDDGLGWVGPQNLHIARARETDLEGSKLKGAHILDVAETRKVACITTDFCMQNMAIQMGLSLISVDGMLIQSIKQWVLRCMACLHVHYDLSRLFCKRCGANHMSRVSCSVDSKTGELRLHLKKNYHVDKRGTKYNLPKPGQQGRFTGEILLREDQLLQGIWRQKVVKIRKDVRSAFGEDVTSDVGIHINKSQQIQVGLGKSNPNARKGRERRGKAKRKTDK